MPKPPTTPERSTVREARARAKAAALEARVREVCARLPRREAAAELGISPNYLTRLRTRFGLVEPDRAARRERVRQALEHSNDVAAAMLGRTVDHVRWLRRKHNTQTTPAAAEHEAAP